MITKKEIDKMKDGVILINCARGGLYNEDDLYDGLVSKKIRYAGIDVFNKEPATNNKLLDVDNITVTPHIGANTKESQEKISFEAANQAIEAARGSSYPNALNLPIKQSETPEWLMPYMELVQKIGFLSAQLTKSAISSIKLTTFGEVSNFANSLLTFATVGLLKESISENVNYVNASFVAKDREIELISEESKTQTPYKNKVSIRVTTQDGVIEIAGTVFDEDRLRIVELNGFELDVAPKGKMIIFKNNDIPGVIGSIGMTLGSHNINIADFRLSRKDKKALALIIVDNEIDNNLLSELSKLNGAISVNYANI
jgi:D-3-phosphoglycerate dehydrogenase